MADAEPRPHFPWLATLVVLAAAGFMVHLGFWQLDRLRQKEAMIAEYSVAMREIGNVDLFSQRERGYESAFYRKVTVVCSDVYNISPMAGRNAQGQPGWAQVARCRLTDMPRNDGMVTVCFDNCPGFLMDVIIGWSRDPLSVKWSGGQVKGTLVPGGELKYHIVADPPIAGLQPNARPDPRDLPNNHLSYAIQWFLFAATALVIYAIALRKRLAEGRKHLAAPGADG